MTAGKVILATLLAGTLSILIALLGRNWLGDPKAPSLSLPGLQDNPSDQLQQLPDFTLTDLQGQTVASAQWQGQVVVLHFWASWCLPCLEALPLLDNAQRATDKLRVVGFAIDTPTDVGRYLAKHPLSYPVVLGGTEAVELSRRLGNRLQGLPFIVIFDAQGQRVHAQTGGISQAELGAQLTPLIAKATEAALAPQ